MLYSTICFLNYIIQRKLNAIINSWENVESFQSTTENFYTNVSYCYCSRYNKYTLPVRNTFVNCKYKIFNNLKFYRQHKKPSQSHHSPMLINFSWYCWFQQDFICMSTKEKDMFRSFYLVFFYCMKT